MSGLTEMMERLGWTVPAEFIPKNAAVCRRCTHEVLWCWKRGTGRSTPLNRDGSLHPWDCRVGVSEARSGETGHDLKLYRCTICPPGVLNEYSPRDLALHRDAKHPITRTLPRET